MQRFDETELVFFMMKGVSAAANKKCSPRAYPLYLSEDIVLSYYLLHKTDKSQL